MTHHEFEELFGEERVAWYRLSPMERMARSAILWEFYLSAGGSRDAGVDSQSPFYTEEEWRTLFAHGRLGVHLVRRGGV